MDNFADEVKVRERNDRETYSLLEVSPLPFESWIRKIATAFPNASYLINLTFPRTGS